MKLNLAPQQSFLLSLISISLFVGIFQITQIEDKLNNYNISNNLSSYLPLGKNIQLNIEEFKLSIFSHQNNTVIAPQNVDEIIQNTQTNNFINDKKLPENNLINQSQTIIDKSSSKCVDNCTVLMIGDSVMGDVFFSFNRLMKKTHPSWTIINAHKVSSGLSNSNYYDWIKISESLATTNKPDFVAILLGTNDAQSILMDKKAYSFASQQWKNSYQIKTNQLLEPLKSNNIPYYWIEIPQVGLSSFNDKLNIVREAQKSQIDEEFFIDTKKLLGSADDPHFIKYRQSDKIHLNATGSDKIAQILLQKIKE